MVKRKETSLSCVSLGVFLLTFHMVKIKANMVEKNKHKTDMVKKESWGKDGRQKNKIKAKMVKKKKTW